MVLPQLISAVNFTHLQALCDDKCPESQTLEFKSLVPGTSDKDKQELAKDIAALANTDGGDLIYGISEIDGSAGSLMPIAHESSDLTVRRIVQIVDATIEPRIQGLKFQPIDVPGGYILLVRVPASFDGPHSVRNNSARRFVMRNGTTTTDMSYDQIRSAFDRTATLAERAHHFINDRIVLIAKGQGAKRLLSGPLFVTHLIPISGLSGRKSVDLRDIYTNSFTEFIGSGWGGGSRTFNFDGLTVHPGGNTNGAYYCYNHIFQNGVMEGVKLGGRQQEVNGSPKAIVWSLEMSKYFYHSIKQFLKSAKNCGFSGPAVLSVAVANVQGYELGIGDVFQQFSDATADRPHLITPEVWLADIDSVNLDIVIRPLLDMLWQAFDRECCPDFDAKTGAYSPRPD